MSGIGSFISNKMSKFSLGVGIISTPTSVTSTPASQLDEPDDVPEQFIPRDLDAEREKAEKEKAGRLAAGQQET